MKRVQTLTDAIKRDKKGDEKNAQRNTVYRMFLPAERYLVDFADDFTSAGWEQFDTSQDAAYFGVWLNRRLRATRTYAEGDWTLVECSDDEHYNAEVTDAIRFYDEGRIARAIDSAGNVTDYVQDRSTFLIGGASC